MMLFSMKRLIWSYLAGNCFSPVVALLLPFRVRDLRMGCISLREDLIGCIEKLQQLANRMDYKRDIIADDNKCMI